VRWIKTRKSINRFSPLNRLLIAIQCPHATDVRVYNAWKKADRQVRKGEKAILVLAPIIANVEVENADTGEIEKVSKCVGFKNLNEFDVSQTDGEPLPERPQAEPLTGDSHAWVLPILVDFAKSIGFTVKFDANIPADGLCSYTTKTVSVRSGEANWVVAVLIHELAHALGIDYKDYNRANAEVIVETVTWMVCEGLNLDTSSFNTDYLATWMPPTENKLLQKFASVIDKTADQIENYINENKKDND
jgi:hypothetical protein